MNTLQLPAHHDVNLSLDFNDNCIIIQLELNSPERFSFEDEYDINVIDKVSKESGVPISQIILKGLFLELQEIGVTVSYENEQYIKQQVEMYCDYCTLGDY
jgi:hypothetical protein